MTLSARPKQTFSFFTYLVFLLLLALLGLLDSGYLTFSHYLNYTDQTFSSFCAISKAFNCDTVAQSPWSIMLGLPVAVWGGVAYLLFLALLIPALLKKNVHSLTSLLLLLGLIYSSISVFFGYISATAINSFCILCLISYAVNLSILFTCWIVRRRFHMKNYVADLKKSFDIIWQYTPLKISLSFLGLFLILTRAIIPHYWEYSLPTDQAMVAIGTTEDGHPWIGAEQPILTIEEYSDYQCFQCYKMHFLLRRLITEHPNRIRLIHHNYPMDHEVNTIIVPEPFHIGSGKLALATNAALFQNKFWQFNDVLYKALRKKEKFVDLEELSRQIGLDQEQFGKDIYSEKSQKMLRQDIRQGWKHTLTGTPSFIVNNKVYSGSLPLEILEIIVQ